MVELPDPGLRQGQGQKPTGGIRKGALDLGAGPGVTVITLAALGLVPVIQEIGVAFFLAAVRIVLSTASDGEANLDSWRKGNN